MYKSSLAKYYFCGYVMVMDMTKTMLKRTADILEKLGVGSIVVGLFQNKEYALIVGVGCIVVSYIFTFLEARQ